MIDLDAGETPGSEDDLTPNPAVLLGGAAAIGVVSSLSLPWPAAISSSALGALMLAGADIDARKFLLPDLVTFGAVACGIVAAPLLDDVEPWAAAGEAVVRAACIAAVLALFRGLYAWLRQSEGLGLGDVKLAAGVGARGALDCGR
jgi:leader peptidase (prepilin peptidase)/N-methyltransferase